MEPITRRTALTLGGLGVALTAAGGAGLLWGSQTNVPGSTLPNGGAVGGDEFIEPEVLRSVNGMLEVTLIAAESTVTIGGAAVHALTYNDGLPGPTLIVHPGDVLSIVMQNNLQDPTNLHTHGLHVSPEGSSDNVFLRIDPGASAEYRYEIPENHPPGVYWYHPHHHGVAADQVFGGLYGAIVVEDPIPIDVSSERLIIISDTTFNSSGQIAQASQFDRMNGREGTTVLVNGQVGPTLTARPGESERWRIVNACSSRYLDLRLDGQHMQLLGNDSGRFAAPMDVTELRLVPGNRADVIVTMAEGTSELKAVPVDRGTSGMMGGSVGSAVVNLATVVVTGERTSAALALPQTSPPRDLRTEAVTVNRTLTMAMGMGGMGGGMMDFTIDGKVFDPTTVDQHVAAGTIEEWTIVNTSPMDHPFHLHVWPMQVLSVGSQHTVGATWQDVVNVPARSTSMVRIAFEDFSGKTVYHCHILDHEDNGMMGVIAVQ
ncbi:MAG: multicopper oxidase family protein [Salinibacterium sp.]|nr:multicopper oxidase family protein [Salinibacterium sp.]